MKEHQINRLLLAVIFFTCTTLPLASQNNVALVKQWGEFGTLPGQFKFPAMITADKNSNLFVVDQHNHRIQKFDKDGNFILMWGKQGDRPGEFNFPYGIAVDSKGYVYVSDMNNNRIQKFTSGGDFVTSTGSYGTASGQFKYPYGIAIDDKDILYVIDAFNYRVQKLNTDLEFLSEWGSQESIGFKLYMPHEIAIGGDGSIILSDRQNHRISVFTSEGILKTRFGKFGEGSDSEAGQLSEPHGVAVDGRGNIYICDRYNFSIHKFNSEYEPVTHWLTSGVSDNSKNFPLGITVANDGSIYITDHYANCIKMYILQ